MMLLPLRVAQPIASTYAAWRRRAPFLRGSGVLFRALRLLERVGAPLPIARGEEGLRIEVGTDCVTVNILVNRAWEREQTARMRRLTPRSAVWFDVGANVGYFTMLATGWVGAAGRVYAIEPVAATRARLWRNLRLNGLGENVVVVPCACGASAGHARIALATDPGHARIDSEGTEEVVVTTVDAIVRNERLDRVDVLKIDTEGHDLEVLRGACETIERFAPAVIAEVKSDGHSSNTPERVATFLESHGYACEIVGGEETSDLIGVPAARAETLLPA